MSIDCERRFEKLEAAVAALLVCLDDDQLAYVRKLTGNLERQITLEENINDMAARVNALAAVRPRHPESDVDALVRLLESRGIATNGLCARDACRRLGWSGERIARAREEGVRAGLIEISGRRSTGGRPAILMRRRTRIITGGSGAS